LATALVVVAGCKQGPDLADVTGKVTYNDQPVVGATIYFIPVGEGKQSIGYTNEDGVYQLQYTLRWSGALIGKHKVSVQIYPREGVKPVPVPEKYGGRSQVEYNVEPGSNRFDIDLSS
jgi:hypothetical protein